MNFNHTIQIATAYPDVSPITNRKGRTFVGDISTDDGVKKSYIKLLGIEDIAKEALSAILARKLGLPVKEPCYVDVSNIQFPAANSQNVAFGTIDDYMPSFKLNQYLEDELLNWQELLNCAIFDEWIANEDRLPNNLIFERGGVIWLIDHDEAFPQYIQPYQAINSQLLDIFISDMNEIDLYRVRNHAMKIVGSYKDVDWNEIVHLLSPDQIPGIKKYFHKYIGFLRARIEHMRDIINEDLGIKQKEIKFNDEENKSREK